MDRTLLKNIFDVVCKHFKECACRGCPILSLSIEVKRAQCEDIILDYPDEIERRLALWMDTEKRLPNKQNGTKEREPETRREILQAAERCVCGERDQDYGGPEDSFALIARLWEPIIKARCVRPGADVCVDAVTVALCMAELKIARATTNETHMDSWVDLAGYAACGGEIAAEKERGKNNG